jgi:hypothetical protein
MHDAIIDRTIACWNQGDAARRRDLIAATFTEAATCCDPMLRGEGQAGIDALFAAARQQFPGLRFHRGGADAHHDRLRFAWELGPEGAAPVAGGTDMAVVAVDGRLPAVTGFIDFAPKGE